jgi:hypothetical protein
MDGNSSDILARLKNALPSGWFGDSTPVLDTLLGGISVSWINLLALLQYVRCQTRLTTATGVWLDLTADDYFGINLARESNESDDSFRGRISSALVRERCTRSAVESVLLDLTGRPPTIFEPGNSSDTGSYSTLTSSGQAFGGGLGYGVSGGWGNLDLPFQAFITTFWPASNGGGNLPGWGIVAGGYSTGCLAYATPDMLQGQVMDDDVSQSILSVLPVSVTIWVRIQG